MCSRRIRSTRKIRSGLGAAWANTMVLVATEFGRTVAVNGTGGTDHGTAASAMLLGGAVKAGRVIADWPGLATAALHEGRDLRRPPTWTASLPGRSPGTSPSTQPGRGRPLSRRRRLGP